MIALAGSSGYDGTSTCRPTPDWKLLTYAVRPPGDDEPVLKQVVLTVEKLIEQAMHGFGTLQALEGISRLFP
jgi:hypothetical protein